MKKHEGASFRLRFCSLGILLISLSLIGTANAAVVTVNAADDIYGVGQTSDPGGGNLPTAEISLDPANDFITFSVTGLITLNGGGNFNDPDGVGAAPSTSSNSGYGSLSGITGPNAGYLVGVFVDGTPSGSAPTALDFTSGAGTSFSSLSPQLDQVFFIGDGLTGDGTGTSQEFIIPTGATELWLGISDACGYNGSPSCYGDNSGTYTVTANVDSPSTPEPSTILLMVGGMTMGALTLRRRWIQRQN